MCNRVGPAVPVKLTTPTNSSIVLHPEGSNETMGHIAVQHLPCNDNHTQEYEVSVSSTEDFTLSAEIVFALLPKTCIVVRASSKPTVFSLACTTLQYAWFNYAYIKFGSLQLHNLTVCSVRCTSLRVSSIALSTDAYTICQPAVSGPENGAAVPLYIVLPIVGIVILGIIVSCLLP